jgi:hypothetical protein
MWHCMCANAPLWNDGQYPQPPPPSPFSMLWFGYSWLKIPSMIEMRAGGLATAWSQQVAEMMVETTETRGCWIIYRGPGFLVVVWFGSSCPFPPSPVSKLDRRHTRRRGGKGLGAEPNHTTAGKSGSSINHSILSDWNDSLQLDEAERPSRDSFVILFTVYRYHNFVYSVRARNYKF